MHKICFTISFISCLYMFREHVLIMRRSKLHYTASGNTTPIGGHLVHGLREVNSRAVTMLRYTRCNTVILMAATAWLMLSFSSYLSLSPLPPPHWGGEIISGDTWKVRYTNQIRTRYRIWRTSATQLQPSTSLCYIGCTSTWLDVHSCVLMREATIFIVFYDGISFQHLATLLFSVFTLCYGTGLLFRGPSCITQFKKALPC
jgi:hypothetical protein